MLLGGLECGGTKMVCAIGDESGKIMDRVTIPTETPEITLPRIIEYFLNYPIAALGIACFGPIDLDRSSKKYGYITSTTKLPWRDFDILGNLEQALDIPCGFDTDVNGACLGEITYGSMRGLKNGIYITVGTGIGVGAFCNGALVHGMLHPEGGHVLVRRHPDDKFFGGCFYHRDCLEGLASGPAIKERTGRLAQDISDDDPSWRFESYYLAQAIVDYIMLLSPERIVLGGGVMNRKHLFPMIREQVRELLGGYITTPKIANLDKYIVPSALNGDQGIMGCMKLAYDEALMY